MSRFCPACASGADCTLGRLSPQGGMVSTNPDGPVEASVNRADVGAVPPLSCQDLDGSTLLRLLRYGAAPPALVAAAADGAPLATYRLTGRRVDVGDETAGVDVDIASGA